MFPERFSNLPEYAFPRLRALLDHIEPGGEVTHMTIGEPKHPFPDWVGQVLSENVAGFAKYPPTTARPSCRRRSPTGSPAAMTCAWTPPAR